MANTFVAAEGHDMGKSLQDKDRFDLARELMARAEKLGARMLLPVDFTAGDAFSEKANVKVLTAEEFPIRGWRLISDRRPLICMWIH